MKPLLMGYSPENDMPGNVRVPSGPPIRRRPAPVVDVRYPERSTLRQDDRPPTPHQPETHAVRDQYRRDFLKLAPQVIAEADRRDSAADPHAWRFDYDTSKPVPIRRDHCMGCGVPEAHEHRPGCVFTTPSGSNRAKIA